MNFKIISVFFIVCPDPTTQILAANQKYPQDYIPIDKLYNGVIWQIECQQGYTWPDYAFYKNITCKGIVWNFADPCICMNFQLFPIIIGYFKASLILKQLILKQVNSVK